MEKSKKIFLVGIIIIIIFAGEELTEGLMEKLDPGVLLLLWVFLVWLSVVIVLYWIYKLFFPVKERKKISREEAKRAVKRLYSKG